MASHWKKLKNAVKFSKAGKSGSGGAPASPGAPIDAAELDIAIEHLLETRGRRRMRLKERTVAAIVKCARGLFLGQPMLLEVEGGVKISGDLHGQFSDAVKVFDLCGLPGGDNKFLFLGDYVDRGLYGLETITLLLALKCRWPEHVFLLRGNHESASINRVYGFFDECKRRFSVKLWKTFSDAFNCMPAAALVAKSILCMHGGLSPELRSLDQIRAIARPQDVPEDGLYADLLWSDPSPRNRGWEPNDRGVSFTFGADVVRDFLRTHHLDLICRAHQVVQDGYEFFADRRLVTLFTAPNYCGQFNNAGAVMTVSTELQCSFKILRDSVAMQEYPNADPPPSAPTLDYFEKFGSSSGSSARGLGAAPPPPPPAVTSPAASAASAAAAAADAADAADAAASAGSARVPAEEASAVDAEGGGAAVGDDGDGRCASPVPTAGAEAGETFLNGAGSTPMPPKPPLASPEM